MRKTEEELNGLFDKFCAEDKNCIDCELVDVTEYDDCGKVFCYKIGYEDGQKDVLEEKERYRWHDLRKNPDDLPCGKSSRLFMMAEKNGVYTSARLDFLVDCIMLGFVIAWREIEPFEEGE